MWKEQEDLIWHSKPMLVFITNLFTTLYIFKTLIHGQQLDKLFSLPSAVGYNLSRINMATQLYLLDYLSTVTKRFASWDIIIVKVKYQLTHRNFFPPICNLAYLACNLAFQRFFQKEYRLVIRPLGGVEMRKLSRKDENNRLGELPNSSFRLLNVNFFLCL